jgi:hypothetical protein
MASSDAARMKGGRAPNAPTPHTVITPATRRRLIPCMHINTCRLTGTHLRAWPGMTDLILTINHSTNARTMRVNGSYRSKPRRKVTSFH